MQLNLLTGAHYIPLYGLYNTIINSLIEVHFSFFFTRGHPLSFGGLELPLWRSVGLAMSSSQRY